MNRTDLRKIGLRKIGLRKIGLLSSAAYTLFLLLLLPTLCNGQTELQKREFFESRIRPVLVEHCYKCHNSHGKKEGDLTVDFKQGVLTGGFNGPAIDKENPDASTLLQALRHENDLRMPKDGPKLNAQVIADFQKWIENGAFDPRNTAPTAKELDSVISWEAVRERRSQWWSFRPISNPTPPSIPSNSSHPVDLFIRQRLQQESLPTAGPADSGTLLRRLSFALTGLPPTLEQIGKYGENLGDEEYEALVDELLASPRFGERWARHWMDVIRFTDSHGSEGDPSIPFTYRYRDYLIRAFNQDISYLQLVREHIAGDLLENPRFNSEATLNESLIGAGHYRFVPHGFSPVDPVAEMLTFNDNQVDVISKAFLGLTISCARCHNHKFDAISQADYYRFFGIFDNLRPALRVADSRDVLERDKAKLTNLKKEIKAELVQKWLQTTDQLAELIRRDTPQAGMWAEQIEAAKEQVNTSPLFEFQQLQGLEGDELQARWAQLRNDWQAAQDKEEAFYALDFVQRWDLSDPQQAAEWVTTGNGSLHQVSPAGMFSVLVDGDQIVDNIHEGGIYTHGLSTRHSGILQSPEFSVDFQKMWFRFSGAGGARARPAVENYPRVLGLLYNGNEPKGVTPQWQQRDMVFFTDNSVHFELATAYDLPIERKSTDRSWWGITEFVVTREGQQAPVELPNRLAALFSDDLSSYDDLINAYQLSLKAAIHAWSQDDLTDQQARFLGFFVRTNLLPNQLGNVPEVTALVDQYRAIDRALPIPTRVPGVIDRHGVDHPLWERGNPKTPGDDVPRGFLEVFGDSHYDTNSSGRLELANDLVNPDNPLVGRVIANRIWHYLFGRGIVSTPDNFGRLGQKPTHPKLLDYLVRYMAKHDWSFKQTIKHIVLSDTFRQSSINEKTDSDQATTMLAKFPINRLDAESIRDSLIHSAGLLEPRMYEGSVGGGSNRRSIYVVIARNNIDPFMRAFDFPDPTTTMGARNTTNVPAQSLTLLNNELVINRARTFADSALNDPNLAEAKDRINHMFLRALSRPATGEELAASESYIHSLIRDNQQQADEILKLNEFLKIATKQRQDIVDPVRQRLMETAKEGKQPQAEVPAPLHAWNFSEGEDVLADTVSGLKIKLLNGALVEDGALTLKGGNAYAQSGTLNIDIGEKTLAAVVQLDNLDQRGGGVINIQTTNGLVFDAIVYGERDSRLWMPGSNGFVRTERVDGPAEATALNQPVHIAITYKKDGTITMFRNGEPYGKPYVSSGLQSYNSKASNINLGLRHSPPGGNHNLTGRIFRAELYNQVLSEEALQGLATGQSFFISQKLIREALSEAQLAQVDELTQRVEQIQNALTEMRRTTSDADPTRQAWHDFAQSLFNLKEFIFIR